MRRSHLETAEIQAPIVYLKDLVIAQLRRLAAKDHITERRLGQNGGQNEKRARKDDDQAFRRRRGFVDRQFLWNHIRIEAVRHAAEAKREQRHDRSERRPCEPVALHRQALQLPPKERK